MSLLLRGGRVLCPVNGLDGVMDVLVREGRIARIGGAIPSEEGIREVDARGLAVLPGLIDMHVHLREPGEEYKETIASGTRAAAAGGFTGVACMPNTRTVNDCAAVTQYILEQARKGGFARVYPVAAITPGLSGKGLTEFADLKAAGAVAVSDDGRPVMDAGLMRRVLEYAATLDMPVLAHSEDLELSAGGCANEGAVATELGLPPIPAAAETAMIQRDILLAEETGGRLHICHVSAAGSVRAIREAKKRGVVVTAETAPHYFSLTHKAIRGYDTAAKMNPPLRSEADRQAVIQGLIDGTLDVIATDHAPHSSMEKDVEFDLAAFGIVGLETSFGLSMELVRQEALTLAGLVEKMSVNPARVLGIDFEGIREGAPADLVVADLERKVVVRSERFFSKSRNTPFEGWELTGAPVLTLCGGRITHDSGPAAKS